MNHSRVTPWISLVTTAAVLMSITYAVQEARLTTKHDSQQLWVNAVLYSLPATDVDPMVAVSFYQLAIKHAQSPSDIYVAYGDYLRGPAMWGKEWLRIVEDKEFLGRVIVDPDLIGIPMDAVTEIMSGEEECINAYLAAVAADPENPLPRFRLAVYGKGEVANQSARWLSKHERHNALGPLLMACHTLETEPSLVLEFVREANSRPSLFFYEASLPNPVGVKYPKIWDVIGFAGKQVPLSAIRALVERQNTWAEHADPLRKSLEAVLDHLKIISMDQSHPQSEQSILAHHSCCHQLVFNSSHNFLISLSGGFRHQDSYEFIQRSFHQRTTEFKKATREEEQIKRFLVLIKSFWTPRFSEITDIPDESVYRGEADIVLLQRQLVQETQERALSPKTSNIK